MKEKDFLLNQAFNAYYNVCKNCTPVMDKDGRKYYGLIYQQPAVSSCTIGRKYVYLRNCNGELARYVIRTGEIII